MGLDSSKKKIAIVVQRYGLEINGGAELHARLLAEKLNLLYHVEILTTCAIDYQSWGNYYDEGVEEVNNIKVRRFKTQAKDLPKFKKIVNYVYSIYKYNRRKVTVSNYFYLLYKKLKYSYLFDFDTWIDVQGPHSEDLVDFIISEKDTFDVFIFFTYLYYPTNIGIREVADKSILIPTAHDEPSFYLKGYAQLFSLPKFIMYNMQSEKDLVEKVYPITKTIKSEIAGIGFDQPKLSQLNLTMDKKFFIYIGRMNNLKGCDMLLDFFNRFVNELNPNVELIFIGQNVQNYKESRDVKFLGFVDEDTKNYYLQNAEALIIPSLFESLSMVTLEAMQMGKPVIANRQCEALKDHVEKSEAGFLFENYDEFKQVINNVLLLTPAEKEKIALNGKRYVERNYYWDAIINKFKEAIAYVSYE